MSFARIPFLSRLHAALLSAQEMRRQAAALRRLDARLLADIGLTRSQAQAAPARPGWDAPRHWQAGTAKSGVC